MHPTTFECYQSALRAGDRGLTNLITSAQHIHVSTGIWQAAEAFMFKERQEAGELVVPSGARLPNKYVILTIENSDRSDAGFSVLCIEQDGLIHLVQVCTTGEAVKVGHFERDSNNISSGASNQIGEVPGFTKGAAVRQFVATIAFVLSLINEPRRVSLAKASGLDWTRQYQKRVERKTGMAVMAYSVVSWQVGAGVKAKNSKDGDSDLKVALHYSRSHWRQCEPENVNAEWVSKFLGGAPGWHQWIKGAWKGHPDHGIKLQRYEPRMPGEKRMSPSHSPRAERDSAAALATMSAEIRAKLVQAGHAPSVSVH